MRMRCLVLALLLFCLLGLAVLGCAAGQGTTPTASGESTVDPALATTTTLRTTTTLAPATWQTLTPAGDPPVASLGGAMVYIPTGNKLLLFGGWAGGTSYFSSVWSYDSATNTWSGLSPGGALPTARAAHAMAYDPTGNRVLVFGGYSGTSYHNDTWAYDVATNAWSELHPVGTVPAARLGHSLVYDPESKKMILFGGYDGSTEYNDTWAYDPAANTWTLQAPTGTVPPARALPQMVYDPAVKKTVLFGGGTSSGAFNDAWSYDLAENSWAKVTLTGSPPAARVGHSLVYDSAKQELVLFGGSDGVAKYYNDLWVLRR
jgi:N-acetylneuraminic acid mutarotase